MSNKQNQVPAAQQALHELRADMGIGPLTEHDNRALTELQGEYDDARKRHIAEFAKPLEHLVEVAGVVVPESEVATARKQGQDVSIHTTAGRAN